jgi:hypothetical protein
MSTLSGPAGGSACSEEVLDEVVDRLEALLINPDC